MRIIAVIDVQNQKDFREIEIQQTGVNNVHLPFLILSDGKVQQVLAKIKFTVSLNKKIRGTHMSRLMEILTEWSAVPLKFSEVEKILTQALKKLETDHASININFKYFIKKIAPVSKKISMSDVQCEFFGELSRNSKMKFSLRLEVPFTSLCPCSKEISDFGAHNQRSVCRVKFNFFSSSELDDCNIENFVRIIEEQGSSEIFPLLKREDEKFVTEFAYKNPKFVEDILRDLVIAIRKIKNLEYFEVECENFESIHNHNAFASHREFIEHFPQR